MDKNKNKNKNKYKIEKYKYNNLISLYNKTDSFGGFDYSQIPLNTCI